MTNDLKDSSAAAEPGVDIRTSAIKEAANRIQVMGGWYGLEEKQTDGLSAEILALIVRTPSISEERNGWVEIKEGCEMPKEGDSVRVVVIDDNTSLGGDRHVYQDIWHYFLLANSNWNSGDSCMRISHWKPLDWPAPLTSVDKEENGR